MRNLILEYLTKKRDRERYKVIKERWEVERLKAEIAKLKGADNEIYKSGT